MSITMLVELAVDSAIVLGVACLAITLVSRWSSAERHFVLVVAAVGALALPVSSMLELELPERLELFSIGWDVERLMRDPVIDFPTSAPASAGNDGSAGNNGRDAFDGMTANVSIGPRDGEGEPSPSFVTIGGLILPAYLLIAGGLAVLTALQRARIGRRVSRCAAVKDEHVLELIDTLRDRLGVRRTVRALVGSSDESPWTWGILRPVVVLPQSFPTWPETERRHALIHELAHIRRLDHLTALLAQSCCTLYWLNPLAWLTASRMRREAENACDDRVLLDGAPPHAYADQLLTIARRSFQSGRRSVCATAMAGQSDLTARIQAILDTRARRTNMTKAKAFIASIIACAVLTPFAATESQEAARLEAFAEFNDPSFWEIVERGPETSEELERVVTAYAANGMRAEAVGVFEDYLMREDKQHDSLCTYCISLLAKVGTPQENEHVQLFFDATDRVVKRSAQSQSGDELMRLAVMTIEKSKNAENWNLGIYFLAAAVSFGVDDREQLMTVQLLVRAGHLDTAKTLAVRLYENRDSGHYQSEQLKAWIDFVDSEIERHEELGSMFVSAAGG